MKANYRVTHTITSVDKFGREYSFSRTTLLYTSDPVWDCRVMGLVDPVIVPC